MSLSIAFYKGVHSGIPGIYNRGVQIWTRSIYSHCELIFSDGMSASASYMDGGVRFKSIEYDPEKWDIYTLPDYLEDNARQWFVEHEGQRYDIWGNVHFVFSIIGDSSNRWFCSEACLAALGFTKAERYNPGDAEPVCKVISHLFLNPPLPLAA